MTLYQENRKVSMGKVIQILKLSKMEENKTLKKSKTFLRTNIR